MRRFSQSTTISLLIVLCSATGAFSQAVIEFAHVELSVEQETRYAYIADRLKCPVCKHQSLASSSSYMADEMKLQVRTWVAQGKTTEEIVTYYTSRYGDWILLDPALGRSSNNVFFVPIVLFVVLFGGTLFLLRRWSQRNLSNNDFVEEGRP